MRRQFRKVTSEGTQVDPAQLKVLNRDLEIEEKQVFSPLRERPLKDLMRSSNKNLLL